MFVYHQQQQPNVQPQQVTSNYPQQWVQQVQGGQVSHANISLVNGRENSQFVSLFQVIYTPAPQQQQPVQQQNVIVQPMHLNNHQQGVVTTNNPNTSYMKLVLNNGNVNQQQQQMQTPQNHVVLQRTVPTAIVRPSPMVPVILNQGYRPQMNTPVSQSVIIQQNNVQPTVIQQQQQNIQPQTNHVIIDPRTFMQVQQQPQQQQQVSVGNSAGIRHPVQFRVVPAKTPGAGGTQNVRYRVATNATGQPRPTTATTNRVAAPRPVRPLNQTVRLVRPGGGPVRLIRPASQPNVLNGQLARQTVARMPRPTIRKPAVRTLNPGILVQAPINRPRLDPPPPNQQSNWNPVVNVNVGEVRPDEDIEESLSSSVVCKREPHSQPQVLNK